jgi:pimeloyl-ACP methyl ester carboxylesterase
VFVERCGRGVEPYFALHGWGGDRRTFAPLAPHVPAGASLYSADLPGCGDSPAPREWSVDAVVAEIVGAVRETGAARVNLVGNCGGAIFALLAAQELGEAVGRVVMIDPFAYLPRYFRLFLAGDFGRRAYDAAFANPLGRWLTNQSLRGRREGTSDLTASFARVDHEVARRYLALFAAVNEVNGVERFRGFAAPVEIAHGERSFAAVRRSLAMWREVSPHVRVHELKGAGHAPILEATAQVSELIFAPGYRPAVREKGSR